MIYFTLSNKQKFQTLCLLFLFVLISQKSIAQTVTFPVNITLDCSGDTSLTATGQPSFGVCNTAPLVSGSDMWINEIHYDNASSDLNEGVEIAGPDGLDLSGYKVVFYNGSSSQRSVYKTQNLSGTISASSNGIGFIWFPVSGLQNGAPDGLALVDPNDVVIEFLSYEGSFVAASGPASGMTSTDIGVRETGSTTSSQSLQRTGSGRIGSDFTWQANISNTHNSINTNQTISPATPVNVNANTFTYMTTLTGDCPNQAGKVFNRTFTAIDDCGATFTHTQVISLLDTVAPTYVSTPLQHDIMISACDYVDIFPTGEANAPDLSALEAAYMSMNSSFFTNGFVTASDNCSDVTYDLSTSTVAGATPQLAIIQLSVTAKDQCGNQADPYILRIEATGGTPQLPVQTNQPNANLSSGGDCQNPLDLTSGQMLGLGASFTVAGETFNLPVESDITGCVNSNAMFEFVEYQVVGQQGCVTEYRATFMFGQESYLFDFTVTDDIAPVVIAPAPITVSCDQDLNDLSVTGTATATDNCVFATTTAVVSNDIVFINEIHYDNAGSDQGEFIEVAVAQGTDLTGYELRLVNQNGSFYGSAIDLSTLTGATIQGYTFLVIDFPANGIQNGSRDGVAICNASGVVEYVTYEGTATGASGCIAGVGSTDMGAEESSATGYNVGYSLQRVGSGSTGNNFQFTGPIAQTKGAPNTGQTFISTPSGGTGGPVPVTGFVDNTISSNCSGEYTIERVFSAEDVCGNVGTGVQIITVESQGPAFDQNAGELDGAITASDLDAAGLGDCVTKVDLNALKLDITTQRLFGQTNYRGWFDYPSATASCGGTIVQLLVQDISITNVSAPNVCQSDLVIRFAASDDCNNTAVYDVVLTVQDDIAPEVDPSTQTVYNFTCGATVNVPEPTFTDNCTPVVTGATDSVWINEFHYDNGGSDRNEFIEVAGIAGINLAGYKLELYNATGGALYRTIDLAGIIANQSNQGIGAVSFSLPVNGIQNGGRDGIALISPTGDVIEFLSYEGTLTANNGSAAGVTSVDVGVREGNQTLATESLQRVGVFSVSERGSWVGPMLASAGAVNNNQIFISPPEPTVTFSDVIDDNPAFCPNGQEITRTYIATDACGNFNSFEQTIRVASDQPGEWTNVPSDLVVACEQFADNGSQAELVAIANALTAPTPVDGCGNTLSFNYSDVYKLRGVAQNVVATLTRTYVASVDGCGNGIPNTSVTVTVEDNNGPIINDIPTETEYACLLGAPTTEPITLDDCDNYATYTFSDVDLTSYPGLGQVGQNSVSRIIQRNYVATDGYGNSSTASRVMRLMDYEGPRLVRGVSNPEPVYATLSGTAQVFFDAPEFSDNCGFTVTSSHNSGDYFPVGITEVVYTATDGAGRIATYTVYVEVYPYSSIRMQYTENFVAVNDNLDSNTVQINFPYATTSCTSCNQEDIPGLEYLGYYKGHRYYVSKANNFKFWKDAQAHALTLGGNLVTLDDAGENMFIQNELDYAKAYIGLSTKVNSSIWTPTIGQTTYTNWATGYPRANSGTRFASISSVDGMFYDEFDTQLPYIIEFDCLDVIPSAAYAANPKLSVGVHFFQFEAFDDCGSHQVGNYKVCVREDQVNYCDPTSFDIRNQNLFDEPATSFESAAIGTWSSVFGNDNSLLVTGDTLTIESGVDYSLDLTTSTEEGGDFSSYWRIWIDLDADGDFYESNEMVFEGIGRSSLVSTLTLSSDLFTMSTTRMRIGVNRYTYPEPCGYTPVGDYRDILVNVNPGPQSKVMLLRGSGRPGMIDVSLTTFELDSYASYDLLRKTSKGKWSKVDSWTASHRDNASHVYHAHDDQPIQKAIYKVVAKDVYGNMQRESNNLNMVLPARRIPVDVYPNPVNGKLTLEGLGEVSNFDGEITINDVVGRVVHRAVWVAGSRRHQVILPQLANGIYSLSIKFPSVAPVTKMIVVEQE